MARRLSGPISVSLVLLLTALAINAQAPTGIITGAISDASGAIIPNATVTIVNKDTNVSRTATANAEGVYSAVELPPGNYEVRAELQGF